MRTTDTLAGTAITYTRVHEDAAATSEYEALTFAMVEVIADDVAALVRAGVPVWSLGYGWDDDDGFTTLGTDDLWAFEGHPLAASPDVVASWGPFHADLGDHPHRVSTDDAGRVRIAPESLGRCRWLARCTNEATHLADAGPALGRIGACYECRPTAAPEPAPKVDQPEPVDVRATIAAALAGGTIPAGPYQERLADAAIAALSAAGVVILAPQDLAWGQCSMTDSGQHELSTSMCVGCLEYDPS